MLKRLLTAVLFCVISLSFANTICSESIYEYYFFPDETEQPYNNVPDVYDSFIDTLPNEIKEYLPKDFLSESETDITSKAKKFSDFRYIWNEIVNSIVTSFFPSVKSTALVIGILLISVLIRNFKSNISDKPTDKLSDTVINTAVILSVASSGIVIIDDVVRFKDLICNLMNGIIPIFGVIYTASGNGSTAAIQSGGVMLLVTICQNLFAMVLMPSVRICLLMSIINGIFPDSGIKSVSTVFKNISVGIMVASVTLFSFILSLQNTIAQSTDSFSTRSIKFAVGNLVPIIVGAVSDSLGTIGGSLAILKTAGGTILIISIILLIMPTLSMLMVRRLSFFICKSVAAMLGCTSEEKILDDMGSTVSMMLAFSVAISIAFIYVLTLFTDAALAIAS